MTDLHLFWRGPELRDLLGQLGGLLLSKYKIASDDLYGLAHRLEKFIRSLLASHADVVEIDGQLFWIRPLNELSLGLPLRSGAIGVFPDAFLDEEGLGESDEQLTKLLCSLVIEEIETSLQTPVKVEMEQNYMQKSLRLFIDPVIEITDDFEKNQLGIFLYLIYLRRRFANDANICIITSELAPLLKKAKEIENALGSLSQHEFTTIYPTYAPHYRYLRDLYRKNKIYFFRIGLLLVMIGEVGPYIVGSEEESTKERPGKVSSSSVRSYKIEPTRSFRILFDRCKGSASRYSVSFVSVFSRPTPDEPAIGHGTLLLIDHKERVIERFDPNGVGVTDELQRVTEATDEALASFAKSQGYLYAEPSTFCPRRGIQSVEHLFSNKTGYCVSWSILYAEERLLSSRSRNYVAENLLDEIVDKYSLRASDSRETALNVEKWMEERIQKIFNELEDVYDELSDYLEIRVSYANGKLIYFS